jgi:hypothetical protein
LRQALSPLAFLVRLRLRLFGPLAFLLRLRLRLFGPLAFLFGLLHFLQR